jgi:hypothetical protein
MSVPVQACYNNLSCQVAVDTNYTSTAAKTGCQQNLIIFESADQVWQFRSGIKAWPWVGGQPTT